MSAHDDILERIQDAMPAAFSRHPDANITKFLKGASHALGSYHEQSQVAFAREFIPNKSVDMIEEWEVIAAPYEVANRPDTLSERQDALHAKFNDAGDVKNEGYRLFAVDFGYTDAAITNYHVALCTDECTVELYGPKWLFAIRFDAASISTERDAVMCSLLEGRTRHGCYVHCNFA
jgi:uncharacterized protein YmfQ (DUF2313 family)